MGIASVMNAEFGTLSAFEHDQTALRQHGLDDFTRGTDVGPQLLDIPRELDGRAEDRITTIEDLPSGGSADALCRRRDPIQAAFGIPASIRRSSSSITIA